MLALVLSKGNGVADFLATPIAGASTRTRSSSPVYRCGKIGLIANLLAGIEFEEGQEFGGEKASQD